MTSTKNPAATGQTQVKKNDGDNYYQVKTKAEQPHLFQLREMIVQFLGARGDWVPFTRIVQVMKGTGFNRTEVIAQLDALKKAGVIEYQSLVGSSCAHLRVKLRRAGK